MRWPDNFPSDCPPTDSIETNHTVFRFSKNVPPSGEIDLLTYLERWPNRHTGCCRSAGYSVYVDEGHAKEAQKKVPGMRKRHIVKAKLTSSDGRIKNTPSTPGDQHHTWWKAADSLDLRSFVLSAEALEDD